MKVAFYLIFAFEEMRKFLKNANAGMKLPEQSFKLDELPCYECGIKAAV